MKTLEQMNEALTEELRERGPDKHPALGEGRFPAQINHPVGWYRLVNNLHRDLLSIDPNYILLQTKEKFGGLRFYARCTDETMSDPFHRLIAEAEGRSFTICEVCGEPGEVRYGGWVLTLCDTHHEEREASRE